MTSSYPTLAQALAEALVDVLWFIEGCEDEQMDPDDAVKVQEGFAHLVSTLSNDQRQELMDMVGEMAAAETNPARREFLEEFPEGFGLIADGPEQNQE
ncbi:hypothetical protein MBT84_47180 [Streptomyces sp. MBT84]|uniref:hypothetical protein n=1 Tax=Streptomyces sp. MBT84 TaxID=1488414 RepID=UPI001C6EF49E|nr:hypothetical protein [Streptomyces sp. MBT84]MBW8707243.1 hypothetical protein [Streptomyces sp. MBT84]